MCAFHPGGLLTAIITLHPPGSLPTSFLGVQLWHSALQGLPWAVQSCTSTGGQPRWEINSENERNTEMPYINIWSFFSGVASKLNRVCVFHQATLGNTWTALSRSARAPRVSYVLPARNTVASRWRWRRWTSGNSRGESCSLMRCERLTEMHRNCSIVMSRIHSPKAVHFTTN